MGDLGTNTANHITVKFCSKGQDCINQGTDKCDTCRVQGKNVNFKEKPCQKK